MPGSCRYLLADYTAILQDETAAPAVSGGTPTVMPVWDPDTKVPIPLLRAQARAYNRKLEVSCHTGLCAQDIGRLPSHSEWALAILYVCVHATGISKGHMLITADSMLFGILDAAGLW